MLESIRNRANGPIVKFVIGLIIIPFAFAGVYSYFSFNTSNAVATVNGEDISLSEFDRSYRLQQQKYGENFDMLFNTDERLQQLRVQVLQQLINQRLSSQAIRDMGLRSSNNQLRQIIINTPDFHNETGKFDESRYKMLVQSAGYSINQYQAARKVDLASLQFMDGLHDSNFVLKHELDLNIRLQNQTRDFSYLMIPQDHYLKQVELTGEEGESEISSYYEMNKSSFSIPEKVSVEYLYITRQDPSTITISDGQVFEYYNENVSDFETSERRRLAHILVTVPMDADQNAVTEAETKINQLASRIQSGESFEDVAKEASEDDSTAGSGGDLDWIEPGMMDESFEKAAFALSLSSPLSSSVRSEFGFHLIKLLDLESGEAKPVEELKGQIISTLQNRFVEDKFFDVKEAISVQAFEISDSLTEISQKHALIVRSTGLFDQQSGRGLPKELQNQQAILETAFSEDVLYQSLNSELIELTDGNAVVLRLKEHQKAGIKPKDEVKEQIVNLLKQQKAREAIEVVGNQILTALNDGKTTEEVLTILPDELMLNWQQHIALGRNGTEVNTQLVNEIFSIPAPVNENPVFKGVLLYSGSYAVVSLTAVNEGVNITVDVTDEKNREEKFIDYHSQSEIYGYLKYLDEKASISRSISNVNLIQ